LVPDEEIKIKLLSDYILVQTLHSKQTAGGIALPEGADPEPPRGIVRKVGPGRITDEGTHLPMPVKPGDVVIVCMQYFQGIPVMIKGVEHGIIRVRDIVGVVEQ
jgi:chaperonin GroES